MGEGGEGMKTLLLFMSLIMVAAGSTCAETTDFFELVKTRTPQSVQAAISKGADVNARNQYGLTSPICAPARYQNTGVSGI